MDFDQKHFMFTKVNENNRSSIVLLDFKFKVTLIPFNNASFRREKIIGSNRESLKKAFIFREFFLFSSKSIICVILTGKHVVYYSLQT
jgi:hypothetical protein